MPTLYKFEEFLALPPGAIFSQSDASGNVRGLFRKGTSLLTSHDMRAYYKGDYSDFYYHDLLPDAEDGDGKTWPNINDGGRWGSFDPEELFVVYNPSDIEKMVGFMTGTAKVEGEKPNGIR